VRRWLAELKAEGLIIVQGKRRATRYQALSHVPLHLLIDSDNKALHYINRPLFERKPVTYHPKWLEVYTPNQTYYLKKEVREKLWGLGDKNKRQLPAGTYAHQIYNRLLIDLSYNSSRLEGNTYSLLETKRLILEGKETPGKLDEEKIMILNHKEAIAYLINHVG
jgi:hypothetical protein